MAPRKGGVTKDAVTSTRIQRRNGMSVRATSQASGAATATDASATATEIAEVLRNGSRNAGLEKMVTKLPAVKSPALSVKA